MFLPETKVSLSSPTLLRIRDLTYVFSDQSRALEEIDALFATAFNPFRPQNIQQSDSERQIGELEGGKDFEDSVLAHDKDSHDDKHVSAYVKP